MQPDQAVRVVGRYDSPGTLVGIDRGMISRVVYNFYAEIRKDAVLGPIFNARIAEARWPVHLETMVDFWSSVLLTTGAYKGKPVPAHLPLALEDSHFSRWLNLFQSVAEAVCPPAAAALFIDRAERIADSLRFAIATHKSSGGAPVFPTRLAR
ncbi:MAG TPA: group III truncated hemoglobin [Rhabdaerophilum sp.]|nr:group III truncated hemoglobin [Rhabdaerophilum sp.]